MRVALFAVALSGCICGFDPSAARPYPCNPDAGNSECRGGWVCGIDRVCHSPEPGAWACNPDAGDSACYGWHCGLQGVCYSLDADAGAPLPCDYAREVLGQRSDCPMLWRCGLENHCHVRGDVEAWQCGSDSNCEGAWRCGPHGVCIDGSSEAPTPSPSWSANPVALPLLYNTLPELIVGSDATALGGPEIALLNGTSVTFVFAGWQPYPDGFSDGGAESIRPPWSLTLPRVPNGVANGMLNNKPLSLFAFDDDMLFVTWELDGGISISSPDAGGATGVYASVGGITTNYTAWQGSMLYDVTPAGVNALVDAGEPILDLVQAETATFSAEFFATASGLSTYYSSALPVIRSDGGQVPFPPGARLFPGSAGPLVVTADGTLAFGLIPNTLQELPDCSLCASAAAISSVHDIVDFTGSRFEVRCETDAGTVLRTLSFGCNVVTEVLTPTRRYSTHGAPTWAASRAQLGWTQPGQVQIFGGTDVRLGFSAPLSRYRLTEDRGAILATAFDELPLAPRAGIGLVPQNTHMLSALPGAVHGEPTWRLNTFNYTSINVVDASGAIQGTFGVNSSSAQFTGAVSNAADGTRWLAMADDDRIQAAPLGAQPATLAPKVVPFPGLVVTSLVLLPGDADAGTLLQAYALTSAGVSYIQAYTPHAWTSSSVALPAGDWAELLSDGTRARVAYTDGRVFTLPSRLQVAAELPDDTTALDFDTAGTTDLCFSSNGLMHLTPAPDGGALSTWEDVPLPAPAVGAPLDFSDGRVFAGTSRVWVLTADQSIFSFVPDAG